MIIQGEEFSGEERSCVIFLIFIFILVKLTILSLSLSVSFLFFQNQTNSCSWPKFPSQGTRVINLGEIKVPPLVYGTWCTDVIGNDTGGTWKAVLSVAILQSSYVVTRQAVHDPYTSCKARGRNRPL